MSVDSAKELKEFRIENANLKRIVADANLKKLMLKEIAKENFEPITATLGAADA